MEIVKVVHMKSHFPHGDYAACGRDLKNAAVSESWAQVTCKNCKAKQAKCIPYLQGISASC